MAGHAVQLRVGGQSYRVVTSASEDEVRRWAAVVDEKLAALGPSRSAPPGSMLLLAAIALVRELEVERARADAVTERSRDAFGRILRRVDAALAAGPSDGPDPDAGREASSRR